MFAYILGLIAGLAQPTQTSINGITGTKVKSPFIATVISFSTALVILLVIDMIVEGNLNIPLGAVAANPLWIWCGGFCGVGIVCLSIICLPYIGSAMVVVMTSFGQIITSMIIDQFGMFRSPQIVMTLTRLVGAVLVVAGVVLASREPKKSNEEGHSYPLKYLVLSFVAGMLCAIQIAVNGTLGKVVGSGWFGTTISMSFGLMGSILLVAIIYLVKGRAGVLNDGPDIPFKWYMLTGGSFGVIIVGTNSITAPLIGAGMVSIMNLIGFMIGGLIIDATGFLGIDKKPITVAKIVGVLAMVGGTVVITLL